MAGCEEKRSDRRRTENDWQTEEENTAKRRVGVMNGK